MAEVLTGDDIRAMLQGPDPLVDHMIDPELQLQPNGVELTLRSVEELGAAGSIGLTNQDRTVAPGVAVAFDATGWAHLAPGCYRIVFNEVVHIPADVVAMARPRSSLVRNGATVETGLWDSSYHGRSESLLIIFNRYGCNVRQNARLIQLIFFKLRQPVAQGYSGRYQGEHL